jgi:hypothetical protein
MPQDYKEIIGLECVDIYLQHTTPTTLDMIIGHIILQIKKVLPFGVLLLEG